MNVKCVAAADFETSRFYLQEDHFDSNITKSFEWRIEQSNRLARMLSEDTSEFSEGLRTAQFTSRWLS
jgi:hypothetical protein